MLLLSMVPYQVLLFLDTYDTDAIAINKLCKLNFRYYTMYCAKVSSRVIMLFFKYGVYFFETLVY